MKEAQSVSHTLSYLGIFSIFTATDAGRPNLAAENTRLPFPNTLLPSHPTHPHRMCKNITCIIGLHHKCSFFLFVSKGYSTALDRRTKCFLLFHISSSPLNCFSCPCSPSPLSRIRDNGSIRISSQRWATSVNDLRAMPLHSQDPPWPPLLLLPSPQ